ncbi:MAG: DUF3488 domain-containing protein [Planctomycetes bacterium]|nr:DUF3488 domain-containing protein [Planctomycetota bacterium]
MRDRLLPFLLVLTLLDLAFVQATEVVATAELLPLWGLTVAAPWLRRLQRWLWCRIAWNGGVLVVFALLVRHATTSGLLHMLEDGLVLAVLCQVHLLNNIGARQRPDLVFFNSLLVAFVTSFFAPDLSWSVLFGLHAFALVAALQVNVLVRRGDAVDGAAVRGAVHHAVGQATAALVLTGALFVLLPRDFTRQGWLGDALGDPGTAEAGLAERIHLDDARPVQLGEQVVVRIRAADGGEVPSHWRAIAFATFDGATWFPQEAGPLGSRFATDPPWDRQPDGSWRRTARGEPGGHATAERRFRVRLHDVRAGRLPLPLPATAVHPRAAAGVMLDTRSFGGFVMLTTEDAATNAFEYDVDVAGAPRAVAVTGRTRERFTALPERGVPPTAHALAQQLRAALPADADVPAIAAAASDWLQQNRRYGLPGEPGFARNLGEFLLGTGAGHCEYFATALAILLRLQAVPCRVVGGWLAHESDATDGGVVVRSRDAHAWVEALAEDGRWLVLDATPAADVTARRGGAASWWDASWRGLEDLWSEVVGFDGRRRADWLQTLLALPGSLAQQAWANAPVLAATLALVGLLAYRRRRRQHEPAIVEYERAVRAAGLSLLEGETPRELLRRADAGAIEAARLQRLHRAVQNHERQRYGRPASAGDGGTT